MSTESSSTTSTATSGNTHATLAGVIGAVVTVVLYWINLALFSDTLITSSGVWITIIVSTFITGYLAATYSGR